MKSQPIDVEVGFFCSIYADKTQYTVGSLYGEPKGTLKHCSCYQVSVWPAFEICPFPVR